MRWRSTFRVGETVWGDLTYGQADDYARVCEYENAQLDKAIAECKAWLAADPLGFDKFNDRVNEVTHRLPALISALREDMRGHDMAATMDLGTKAAYEALRAWRKDLDALYNEFASNPHGCTLPTWSEPQPQAADPQLATLHTATEATKTIEKTASDIGRVSLSIGEGVLFAALGLGAILVLPRLSRR